MPMDPNYPATKQLMRVLDDLRLRAATTLTTEECRQIAERAEADRRIRQIAFHPRPVDVEPDPAAD